MLTIVLPSAFPEVCARDSCLLLLFVSNLRAVFLCDPTDIWSPDAGWCFDVSNCTMLDGMYKVHDSIKLWVACRVRISLQTGFRRGKNTSKERSMPFSFSQFTHICYRAFRENLKLRHWIEEIECQSVLEKEIMYSVEGCLAVERLLRMVTLKANRELSLIARAVISTSTVFFCKVTK